MRLLKGKETDISLVVVMGLAFFLVLQLIDDRLSLIKGGDSLSYLTLAKAIATGNGYSDIFIPGHPPHTQYPPLLPLLLSPVFYLLGFNFFWMRLVIIAFAVASVYMVRVYFEKEADRRTGTLIALAVATNFGFLFFARELMTEVPYIFLSLVALSLIDKYLSEDRRWLLFGAVVAVSAAYFMRMIGITIYLAGLAALLLNLRGDYGKERLKKTVYFAAACAVPFALWSLRGSLLSEGVNTYNSIFLQADYYSKDSGALGFSSLAKRVETNVGYIIESMPIVVMTITKWPQAVMKYFNPLFFILFSVGLLREVFIKRSVGGFYVLFYLSLLAVWPVYGLGDEARYIVPILPFIYLYVAAGVASIAGLVGKARPACAPGGIVFVTVCSLLILANAVSIRDWLKPATAYRALSRSAAVAAVNLDRRVEALTPEHLAADFFARNFPCYSDYMNTVYSFKGPLGSGVVVTRKPELVSLITGGYAVRFPYTRDMNQMEGFLKRSGADYVVAVGCYPEDKAYLGPFIEARGSDFERIFKSPEGNAVLRYRKGG